MKRAPEAELMLGTDQAAAYAAADLSELHGEIVALFAGRFGAFPVGSLLDLGCGTGDCAIRFARACPTLHVFGLDASPAMLVHGREAVSRAGVSDRVRLENGYLPDTALERGAFDTVFANSLLHHLSNPQTLWDTAKHAGRTGSAVFVMDLRRPAQPDTVPLLVQRFAEGADALVCEDFANSLRAAYTVAEVREQLAAAGLEYFSVEEHGPLHLIAWGVLR